MRFRLGMMIGFGAGYYLGAMAGRERYDQINKMLGRAKESDVYETATERAKDAVDTASEKAKAVVDLGMERAKDATGNDPDSLGAPTDNPLTSTSRRN